MPVLDQANSFGDIFSWLCHKQVRRLSDDIAKLVQAALQIVNGEKSFAGESSNLERFGLFEHELALIQVAEPIGLDCW